MPGPSQAHKGPEPSEVYLLSTSTLLTPSGPTGISVVLATREQLEGSCSYARGSAQMADDTASNFLVLHADGHRCTDPYPHALPSCTGFASQEQAQLSLARDSLDQLRQQLEQTQREFEHDPTPANGSRLEIARAEYDSAVLQAELMRGVAQGLSIE